MSRVVQVVEQCAQTSCERGVSMTWGAFALIVCVVAVWVAWIIAEVHDTIADRRPPWSGQDADQPPT